MIFKDAHILMNALDSQLEFATTEIVWVRIFYHEKQCLKPFLGCEEIGYTELDCTLYAFTDHGKAREDCKQYCATDANWRMYGNDTLTNATLTNSTQSD